MVILTSTSDKTNAQTVVSPASSSETEPKEDKLSVEDLTIATLLLPNNVENAANQRAILVNAKVAVEELDIDKDTVGLKFPSIISVGQWAVGVKYISLVTECNGT